MSDKPSTTRDVRLRKSCDRCQAAKVKCSRVKPSCWRCSQDGYECVYGPFRATGRPSKSNRLANESSTAPRQDETENPTRDQFQHQDQESAAPIQYREQQGSQQSQIQFPQFGQALSIPASENNPNISWPCDDILMDMPGADFVTQELGLESQDDTSNGPVFSTRSGSVGEVFSTTSISDSALSSWKTDPQGWAAETFDELDPSAVLRADTDLSSTLDSAASVQGYSQFRSTEQTIKDVSKAWKMGNSLPHSRSRDDCLQALTRILAHLTKGSSEGESASLDELLNLDRQLRTTAQWVITFRQDLSDGTNQTIIILLLISLGNLLSQFEVQKDAATAMRVENKVPRFLDVEGRLQIGDFAVHDNVKMTFQRKLVLDVLDNQQAIVLQLEQDAAPILKGVNRKMAKDMAIDIQRRASLLRGWLRLSA